jgi:tetratricopeptide (TPR) repeat protein
MARGSAYAARAALALCLALALSACGGAPPQQTNAELRRERMVELNDRARAAVGRGELRRAVVYYGEALRLAELVEDFRVIGLNSLNLAAVLQALGEPEQAHRALERVISSPSRFDAGVVGEAAGRKSYLALQAGQLDAAEEWLQRSEKDCRPPACRRDTALVSLRALLTLERGAPAEARKLAARALAASRSEGNREEEANALRIEGRAATAMNDRAAAMAALNQALAFDKQLALPFKIGLDLLALAEAELAGGERAAARDYAQRALDVSRATGNRQQQDAALRLIERVK